MMAGFMIMTILEIIAIAFLVNMRLWNHIKGFHEFQPHKTNFNEWFGVPGEDTSCNVM